HREGVAGVILLHLALDAVRPDATLPAILAVREVEEARIARPAHPRAEPLLAPLVLEADAAVAELPGRAEVSRRLRGALRRVLVHVDHAVVYLDDAVG